MLALRNMNSASTGYTPHELLFGREMRFPIADTSPIPKYTIPLSVKQYVFDLQEKLKLTNTIVVLPIKLWPKPDKSNNMIEMPVSLNLSYKILY